MGMTYVYKVVNMNCTMMIKFNPLGWNERVRGGVSVDAFISGSRVRWIAFQISTIGIYPSRKTPSNNQTSIGMRRP
jgi:hypothetical protein